MLNPFKFLRYLVFAVFVICNAIITSAAVWNLSIVQLIAGDTIAKAISSYLISVGALGLVVIFTVLLFDILQKDVFLGTVWFELLWIGLFFLMELAGAVAMTVQGNGQTCSSKSSEVSPCASTQVLQSFTWICAILLFGYLILVFVSAMVKFQDDYTIWHRSVRKFLWLARPSQSRKSASVSSVIQPSFRTKVPIIVAPRPRRLVPEAVLSYRSGLSLDYEIEHYQPPAPAAADFSDRLVAPLPSTLPVPAAVPPPTPILPQPQQPRPAVFYPAHVQAAINPDLQHPSAARVRRLPLAPSPPPLGDWPAISQPARAKRKLPASYSFTMPVAIQQQQPPVARPPTRSRPSGPRRRSNSDRLSNFDSVSSHMGLS